MSVYGSSDLPNRPDQRIVSGSTSRTSTDSHGTAFDLTQSRLGTGLAQADAAKRTEIRRLLTPLSEAGIERSMGREPSESASRAP